MVQPGGGGLQQQGGCGAGEAAAAGREGAASPGSCALQAHRVAAERGEAAGGVVGYSVRLDTKASPRTRLLFCTTGDPKPLTLNRSAAVRRSCCRKRQPRML